IDDVDSVAFAEDVLGHLRVPEAGLMSEMNARLQHLSHGHAGHWKLLLGVEPPPTPFDDPSRSCRVSSTPSNVSIGVRDFVAKQTRALYHKLDDRPKVFTGLCDHSASPP